MSARTITRHRDYIVAAALLIDGDYPILCTYLQTMRKEAEQCGQEIRIPAKRRRRWKKPLTWAACVAVLCGMATTGVYAAYEPYASVSIVGGTDSVEYTVNRFDQVLGTRVSGREQPPDGKIPRFVHIDKAVEHTVRQEAKEGESVSITVTSRSSGHAERLREHIDDRFRQSGDERNPPEVRVQPPQDTGNAPEESRPSESTEQA